MKTTTIKKSWELIKTGNCENQQNFHNQNLKVRLNYSIRYTNKYQKYYR